MTSRIKLITFDVTNTLIRVKSGVGVQYSDLARKFAGIELDPEKLNKDFKIYFREQNKLYPGYGYHAGISSYQWWTDLVQKLLKSQNVPETRPNLYANFSNYLFHEFEKEHPWQKYPNCDLVLKNFQSQGYKIGIISNFDERLIKILEALKLDAFFNFILIPSKCKGLAKPDRNIFLEAYKRSNLKSPSEYVHIGDSFELDFKPAVASNFHSILLTHKSFTETHTFNENKGEEFEQVYKKNLYATNLIELYNKVISL